jgi:hypothetical protein
MHKGACKLSTQVSAGPMFERCQLLIRIRDKVNPDDPYSCAKLHKAGDVIAILPYDQEPGREERSNPDWLLLKVGGEYAMEECVSLTTPQLHNDPGSRNRMLQKRGFRLDINSLRVVLDGDYVDWHSRIQIQQVPVEIIAACKVEVPVLVDPNVAS